MSEQYKKVSDNPNKNATVGFVIFFPFQYFVYKNIYKHLRAESEFIVDLGVYLPVRQTKQVEDEMLALLRKEGVYFRILAAEDYFYESYLRAFFKNYRALVSVWERGCMNIVATGHIKKINATYGAGKELTAVRPSQGIFDLALVYSERMARLHDIFSHSAVVGNPKFDDWFAGTIDDAPTRSLRKWLSPDKKTLLYLPTHSDLSSIDHLAEELKKCSSDYNIVVKLHYFTPQEEPDRVRKLTHKGIFLLMDDTDLLPLLKLADVVLSDNSSAIFDAVLADKPVLVSDFWDEEYLDDAHRERKQYRRGFAGAVTYSGSIEQVAKRDGMLITLKEPAHLRQKVAEALSDSSYFKERRAGLRRELYSYTDAHSGKRAADAIRACIADTGPRRRPIMYHAIEAYRRTLALSSREQKLKTKEKLSDYRALLEGQVRAREHKPYFSIVLLPGVDTTTSEMRLASLRGVLFQDFPHDMFEVIVIDCAPDEVAMLAGEVKQALGGCPEIKRVDGVENTLHADCARMAIEMARGQVVCFTRSGFVVPSAWLANFLLAYEKNPHLLGVGGYVVKQREDESALDEYYYLEIGKKLGVEKLPGYLSFLYKLENHHLFQNPVGVLGNMSYKKEAIKNLPIDYQGVTSFTLLEQLMKLHVLSQEGQLCFLPLRATNLHETNMKSFLRQNFEEGIVFYHLRKLSEEWKQHDRYTLGMVIKLPLMNMLDGTQKGKLSGAIFLGALFRWLGGTYARLLDSRGA